MPATSGSTLYANVGAPGASVCPSAGGAPDGPGWIVRAFPNRYPALAAEIAAIAGILVGFQNSVILYPNYGPLQSIYAIGFAVIGGVGYVAGPVLGSTLTSGGVATLLNPLFKRGVQLLQRHFSLPALGNFKEKHRKPFRIDAKGVALVPATESADLA